VAFKTNEADKYPKPSQLAQHIKDLGGKVNIANRINATEPFQIIFTDFTRIECEIGIFYLICFHDKVSRRIIEWNISIHADSVSALIAYKMARQYLKRMKINLSKIIIHQDQDSVFTEYEYAGSLLNDGINLSFTERGFKDNPQMESCNGKIKDEYLDQLTVTKNYNELKNVVKKNH
jgi:transposase InsO family protein